MAPEDRLDRIEGKVDKLVEAMTAMIRFEEQIASHQAGMERFGFRVDDLETRVETMEKRQPIYELWAGWAGKLTLVLLTGLLTATLTLVIKNGGLW